MSNKDEDLLEDEGWEFTDDDEEQAEEDEEANLPVAVDVDAVQLPAAWASTSTQVDEVRKHRKMFNLKHGLFVNVPMVCKNDECPLKATCTIPAHRRPTGERCPIEIAAIIDRYDKYCNELGIGEHDYFDQSQVKDLVDIEIKLMRANGVLATSADFIEQVIVGVDSNGNKLTAPQLHQATAYEEKLLKQKAKILNDLNSTRKQKEKNKKANDPSSFASQLVQKAMRAQMRMMHIVDVDSEDVYDDTPVIDVTSQGGENEDGID